MEKIVALSLYSLVNSSSVNTFKFFFIKVIYQNFS
jgi:hypothetical protein